MALTQSEKLDIVISEIQYIKALLEDNPKTGQVGIIKMSNVFSIKNPH